MLYVNGIPNKIKKEILFIFSLLFSPLLAVVTSQVTAPALIIVGVLMAQSNKIPVVIAVIPERPPTAIPADDSTYAPTGDVPNREPAIRTCERYQYDSNVGRGFNVPISNIL
jgi:hypothetical protein